MTRQLTAQRQDFVEQIEPWARRAAVAIAKKRGKLAFVGLAISGGLQGAVEAAGTYDLSSPVPYEVYARPRIRGAIQDALRDEQKHWPAARVGVRDAAVQVRDPSDVRTDSNSHTEDHIDSLVDDVMAGGLLSFAGEILRTQGEAGLILRGTYAAVLSALDQALSQLNPTDRRLVELHYYQGLTWEAVASAFGRSKRWATRRDEQIRKRLGAWLRGRGVRPARSVERRAATEHA